MTGPPRPTNGWREGRDPVQRLLRILTVLVCLGTFVYLIADPGRSVDDWPTIALALGAALVLLGYEGIVRLPFLGKPDNPAGPEPPPRIDYQQWRPPEEDPYLDPRVPAPPNEYDAP
jgi:hypothetical protein